VTVVTALLLPAIVQAQVRARATKCQNNLKQIALALHNYHDTYNGFPPGWVWSEKESPSGATYSWIVSLLPYMDQAPLFNQIDFQQRMTAKMSPQSRTALQTLIPVLRCSNDKTPPKNPYRGDWPTSNYSGNFGDNPLPVMNTAPEAQFLPGTAFMGLEAGRQVCSGFFHVNSRIGLRDVTDGTSNTIMVGERGLRSGSGILVLTAGNNYNDIVTDGSHASRLNSSPAGFSSPHNGIVNFVFGDGAVRAIKDTIDSQPGTPNDLNAPRGILQKLCNRRDGQVIGDF